MLPNSTLRGWHLDQMRKSVQIIHSVMQAHSEEGMTSFRDGGTGWTVLQVICHLGDYEAAAMERAQLTINQDNPALPNFNADELAAAGRYNEQNLVEAYVQWSNRRSDLLTYLEKLNDADWERTAIHSKRGLMSLQDQLALTAWHDVNHLEQLTRILAEKKA